MEKHEGSESPETQDTGLVGWWRRRWRGLFGQALNQGAPPAPEAAAPVESDAARVAREFNAIDETLRQQGCNMRQLEQMLERMNLAVDDPQVFEYIRLAMSLGLRRPIPVEIRAGMSFYDTMVEIVREGTGQTFARDKVLHEGVELLAMKQPYLLLTIDTDDEQTAQDPEVLKFANQIRSMAQKGSIRYSILGRGRGDLPTELGRQTTRFRR